MSIADSAIPSSKLFDLIKEGLEGMSDKEKKDNIKKVNGIFEMNVKSGSNEATYTIDLKKEGKVYKGPAKPKADVTISLADDVFQQLADGKINGQKAFMSGKLKVRGNIMLATKLDTVLKGAQKKANL
ncbi:sterol-binding protein [Rhodotorula diobovata]|uniref:Sterol-binding protein n=1 Tax=Rhodotorula diobovata TaxID=5288 RepID=A0A5C5G7E2_9BASI|nr:sterol-binding protein [Rhodotorula diobovata]